MGWGSFLTSVASAASDAAKSAATKIGDSAAAAAEHWIDEKIAQYNATKAVAKAAYHAGVAAKDYAVEKAVAGIDYTKKKVVQGAVAIKDAAIAGAKFQVGAAERLVIEARSLEAMGPSEYAQHTYAAMKSALGSGNAGSPTHPCPFKTAECNKLQDALEKAILANEAYAEERGKYPEKGGYNRLDPDNKEDLAELKKFLLTNDPKKLLENKDTDFSASVFKRIKNGKAEYVISYRGTKTGRNWSENVKQATGQINPESTNSAYVNAMTLANRAKVGAENQGAALSFTGHSLGGGMASAAAAVTKLPANTYNAAGLHSNTVPGGYPDPPADVEAYYDPTDPLSALQDHREILLGGAIAALGALNPAAGQMVGAVVVGNELADKPAVPRAYGNRRFIPLPPSEKLRPIDPLEGHSMPLLIDGIKAEQNVRGCN